MTLETKIKTILTADANSFVAGVQRADASLKKAAGNWDRTTRNSARGFDLMGLSVKNLAGIFAGFSMQQFAQSALQTADQLQTLSERTGVSATTLSALQFAIEDAGGSLSGFGNSINIMQNAIGELAKGTKSAVDNFARLGLSFSDLQNLSAEQQFFKIAEAIGKLGTSYERTEAARNIFGRGAASLIPIINQTSGAIDEFVSKQEELGKAVGSEQVARVDEFGDAIKRMGIEAKNTAINAFGALLMQIDAMEERRKRLQKQYGGAPPDIKPETADFLNQRAGLFTPIPNQSIPGRISPPVTQTPKPEAKVAPVAQQSAITQEIKKQRDEVKALTVETDKLATEEEKRKELIDSIGLTFTSSFEDAIVSGRKLSDVIRGLAQDMLRLMVRKQVTEPALAGIGKLTGGGIGNLFGGQGSLARLFNTGNAGFIGPMLPSFDVGSNYVPRDMVAQVHKGEMIIPYREAEAMRNGSGSNSYVFNVGTDVSKRDIALLQNMIVATAGPGVIERRVTNAQKRGQI